MEQGDLAPVGLIEVAPGSLEEGRSEWPITPEILASRTCSLYVRFKGEVPPSFDLDPGRGTAFAREVGYWLVSNLEGVRLRAPERVLQPDVPTRGRRAWQALRVQLTERFVLPEVHIETAEAKREGWIALMPKGFEASRRVFRHRGAAESVLICHVFAQLENDAADRLLVEFVEEMGHSEKAETVHCDPDADLCLWGRSSGRLAGKSYVEIVIAPPRNLPKAPLSADDKQAVKPNEPRPGTPIRLPAEDRVHLSGGGVLRGEELRHAFSEDLYERADLDWKFVAARITEAYEAGEDLGEPLAERVARERYERAKAYQYADRPDAGPTFESSLEIVRTILKMHLAALHQQGPSEA